ncbi:MAG: 30S ribosomal protein S5 [Candidatus Nealsonbacteria bacterium]|nr:30S ribosomal protein S5 [Candidatus Nealsonbacteria bacterium]
MTVQKEIPKNEEFESKLLNLSRVERMTGGGRRLRFQAVVVVGDKNGKVGVASAKSTDVSQAIEKATKMAKKRMITVLMVDDTIPHQTEAKFGAAQIILRPQIKGRGLVAGGTIRTICLLAGIKNISAKAISRTDNKLNNAKATIKALEKLKVKESKKVVLADSSEKTETENHATSSN